MKKECIQSDLDFQWESQPDGSVTGESHGCKVSIVQVESSWPIAVDGYEWEYRYTTPTCSGSGVVNRKDGVTSVADGFQVAQQEAEKAIRWYLSA